MALFPLSKPLEGMNLTTTACHLYRQSLMKLLPLVIAFAFILHLIQNGHLYVPEPWKKQYLSISMFLAVFTLPILALYIIVTDRVSKGKPILHKADLEEVAQRFPSLMAVLISMLLIPSILFAIGIGIQLYLLSAHAPTIAIVTLRVVIGLLIFAAFTRKLFAPFLVFTDSLDSNSALETSDILVKDNFFKTYLYGLSGLVFFGLLLTFADWLPWLIPQAKAISAPMLHIIGQVLVAGLGSWSFALWMTQLADSQCRKKNVLNPPKKAPPKAPPSIKKPLPEDINDPKPKEDKKDDTVSF